jgi:hypothetical protein
MKHDRINFRPSGRSELISLPGGSYKIIKIGKTYTIKHVWIPFISYKTEAINGNEHYLDPLSVAGDLV